jgi:hypothetical protein
MNDTLDGLILTQEGNCVRARSARKNFLFRNRTPKAIRAEYEECINKVRDAFRPRAESTLGLVSKEELDDLTQDIALYWMYFYIINRLRVKITDDNLAHQETKSHVWNYARRKYGYSISDYAEGDVRIRKFCALLLSIPEGEFDKWLTAWKRYLDK